MVFREHIDCMMRGIAGLLAVAALLLPGRVASGAPVEEVRRGPAQVVVIPVQAEISKPGLFILRRGLKEAAARGVDGVVLDMKTPGGSAAVTLEIMEALDRYDGRTITYVNDEAGSAGALIAAVTDEIHFAPNGVMGSAELIFGTGQDVGEGLKRKMNSFIAAKVRAFSDARPMRADVIKAMMDPQFEFRIGDEVIKAKGELLTLTAQEAVKTYGDPPEPLLASGISHSLEDLVRGRFGADAVVTRLEVTWSERVAQYLTSIAPVLLAIGLLCLFIEFKTPGFGVFGVSGIILVGLVFSGQFIAGLSGHEPLLFFLLGVALLAVEVFFLQGTLIPAIAGAVLMLGSLVWAMADLWPGEIPTIGGGMWVAPLAKVLSAVVLAVVMFIGLLRFLPKGARWSGMVLETAVGGAPAPALPLGGAPVDAPRGAELLGRNGTAATPLLPSGQVEIAGLRYEARLAGGSADAGAAVTVTGVSQFGLIVEVLS